MRSLTEDMAARLSLTQARARPAAFGSENESQNAPRANGKHRGDKTSSSTDSFLTFQVLYNQRMAASLYRDDIARLVAE
jgi:hypothetical protein